MEVKKYCNQKILGCRKDRIISLFSTFIMVAVSFGIIFMNQGAVQIATQYGLNENASDVILGIILFFLIGAEFFINYRVERTKK